MSLPKPSLMVEEQDRFAYIISKCRFSSSQEEILGHSKFSGEDDSGEPCMESKSLDEVSAKEFDQYVAICADCEENEDLGFPVGGDGEARGCKVIDLKVESVCVRKRESFQKGGILKKSRVLRNEGYNYDKDVEVVRSDIRVDSGQNTVKLGCEDEKVGEIKVDTMKMNLKIGNENSVGIVNGNNANGKAKIKDDENPGDGKREWPGSLFRKVWDGTASRGEGVGSREGVFDEGRAERNGNGKSKGGEKLRHYWDWQRMLEVHLSNAEEGEIDILETAKSRGLTFPRSRFRSVMEVDGSS